MPEETNILSNQPVSTKKNVWVDNYHIPVYTDLKRADEILYATDTQVLNRPKKNYFAMTDLGTSTEELGDEALKKVPVLSTVMGGAGYLTNWLTKNQFMRGALKSAADMTRQGVAGLLKETGNVSAFLGQDVDSRINRAKEIDQKFANLPVPIRAQELLLQNMHAVFEGFKPFNPEYAKERVEALKKEQEKIDTFNRKVKTIVDSFTSAAGLDKTGKDGFFYDFGAGASSFLFSVGALALTRNPALVALIFGVIEGQGTYEQAIEAGIEPEKAMLLGKANQAWITATEVIGEGLLNKLLFEKGVLGKAAVRILNRAKGQSSRQIALKAAGIGALQGGGIEGVQEAVQNVGSDVINILGGADEKTISDIIKDALYAGLLAFPLGGAAGGVGGAVHFATYANNIKTRLVNAGVEAETAESIANETAVEAISEEMTNDTLHAVSGEINSPLTANDRNPQAFARTLTESQQREIAQNAWNVGQRVEQEALKAGRPAEEAKASGEVAQALSNGIFRLAKLTPTEQAQFKINILRGDSAAPAVALNQDGIYKNGKADISTPAFKKWFGNSKVVDEKGAPLVVYHGTNASFSVFDTRKTQTPMFWFTGDKASLSDGRTSTNAKGGIKKVMEVYLNIKNPANSEQYENFTIDQLKARGFDGVKLSKQEGYASDMYIAFSPEQIKSVNNRGTWSTDNPNIYYQTEGTEQENNQNPAFPDELNAILKSAPNKVATAVIGRVSAPLSVAAREHGLNIDGYTHNIDNSAIQHTRKRHGLPQREERLGQLAVTDDDFKNIPQIIYNPDFVAFGAKNKKGLDLIIYGKNMPDGSSIYVEEIRTGKKTLTTNSLRKYKTGVNPSSFANRISNAHGDTGTISIVGKEDFVKNENTFFQGGLFDNQPDLFTSQAEIEETPGTASENAPQETLFTPQEMAPTLPEFKPAKKPAPVRIEDFGEKIIGARKDLWGKYKNAMQKDIPDAAAGVTLSEFFPEINYDAAIAQGIQVDQLAAVKALRDSIPAKPQRYGQKEWLLQLKTARGIANDILSGKTTVEAFKERVRYTKYLAGKLELYLELGYPLFTKARAFDFTANRYTIYQGQQFAEPQIVYEFRQGYKRLFASSNRDEVLDFAKKHLENLPSKANVPTKLDIYQIRSTGEIVIGKKIASGKYVDLKGGFTRVSDATKYLDENRAHLEALLEEKKKMPPLRSDENAPRIGKEYRPQATVVTPERFLQEFGFRGVQFGNWVEQERRAQDLNNAYDALLDMADIIGLPARALSLEGKLGLAFGARGNSKASAHYEHGETVINLTKIKGAGSLGHEWWHALDNYFGRKSNKDAMATNGISENIRPEMQAAYKELVQTVTSVMGERSANADQTRKTDYWKTPVEMTARAFESYLISKAKAKGYRNDYLANVIDLETYKKKGGREEAYPYPMESEMPVLDAAFDKFFATIQTAPIEQGYTLYQGEADFGPRGQVTLDEQAHEAVIKVFQNADPSTVVHELAHVYLTMIQQAAGVSTDTEFANFLLDLNGWLGEPTERGYSRQQQEKFAQGFEAYLAEGKAPNKQLEGVFEQFARWLADIYRAVKDKLHITPEVRSIFDRLMAPSEPVRRSRVGEKLDAAKRLVEQMKKGKGAEVDGISLADIKELVNTLSIRKPKGPETDLLKDLRKHGAEYANAGQIDKEAYKNARVYDKKGGVDDRPDVWLQKMGYMDFADSSEDTLQQAYDMIQRALDGEKVYRLADQAQADERAAYEENLNTILQVFPDIKTAKETLKAISVLEAQGYRAVEKKDIAVLERRLNELEHLTNTGQNTKAGESAFRAADRLRRETANEINKRQLENKEQLLKWLNQAKTTQEIRQATEDVLNYLEQQYAKTDEAKQEKEMLEVPKTDYGALKIKILKSISDINKKASQEVKWARAALAEEGRARRTGRSISAEEKASFDKARRIIDDSVGAPYKKAISAALEGIRHLPAADKGKFLRSFMGARYQNFLPEEIDNLLKRAKTIEETNYKKHMDKKIREMIKQKLFDKSGSGKKALFDAETMNALGELKHTESMTPEEAAQKLQENISWSMNHPEAKLSTASKIVNEILSLRANGINESSMELFKQAYDDLRAFKKAGRSAMNLQKMVRDFRTEKAKAEALAALKKNAQAGLLKRLFLGHIGNWESFLDLAFDKTTKEHYSMLNEEADAMSFAWEQRKAILEGAKRIYGLESNSALQDKINELLKEKEVFMNYSHIDTNPDPAAIRKTGEVFAEELSKMQIINLYIWNKNSVLADRLKNQYKGQLPAMFGRLTSQDRRFGDFLQQSAEQYYQMINSVFVKERGYDLPKAEAYFPSKTERVESELDLLQTAVVMSKNPSFTKFRTDSKMVQMKPANPLNILFNHLEKAADYKFKSEKINEIRRVFKSPILRPELERVLTTDGYQQFQRMIDQFSVDQQKASYDIDKLGDWLTNNYVRGAIALKPSIAIKQLVSAMNYAENMPALKWTEGFIKAVLHPKETVKFMLEADPYLRARYESGSMNEALERMAASADGINKMQKALSFTNLMSLSTRLGDIGAIAFGGKPYVDYLMTEKGMSKEEAFREVRKSTMRTQQFSGKSSLSRWQVQGKNGGYVMRALLAFRNTPAQYARKIAESISEYQRGEISAAQLGKVVAIYAVFNSWVYSLLTSLSLLAWLNGDDDADEMFFSDFILSPFTQVASALPILGEAVSLATEMAKAKVFDKKLNSFGMAEMPLLSDLTKMAAKAMKEDVTGKDILDMFMTMGQYGLGLPSQYLVNIPGAVKDIGEGNAMRGFLKLLGYTKNRAEIATGTKDKK